MVKRIKIRKELKKPNLSVSCEKTLSDDFINACANNGQKASPVIRKFMKDYIKKWGIKRDEKK